VPSATTILRRFLHHAEIHSITGRSYRLKDRAAKDAGAKERGRSIRHTQPRPTGFEVLIVISVLETPLAFFVEE